MINRIGRTIVFGDSWSSAVVAGGSDGGWPVILGVPEENRQGVSGSTAAQWVSDFEGRLVLVQETDADTVIMSLMGNDARHALADGEITADEVSNALLNMRRVVAHASKLNTIVLLYADPFSGTNAMSAKLVPLLNGAIKAACYGIPVIFADTSEWLSEQHFDGSDIHPTQEGHIVIARNMKILIDSLNQEQD